MCVVCAFRTCVALFFSFSLSLLLLPSFARACPNFPQRLPPARRARRLPSTGTDLPSCATSVSPPSLVMRLSEKETEGTLCCTGVTGCCVLEPFFHFLLPPHSFSRLLLRHLLLLSLPTPCVLPRSCACSAALPGVCSALREARPFRRGAPSVLCWRGGGGAFIWEDFRMEKGGDDRTLATTKRHRIRQRGAQNVLW